MPDSAPESSPSGKNAQPFQYAAPTGDAQQSDAASTGNSTGFGGGESTVGQSSDLSIQKAYERGLLDGKANARADFEKTMAEIRGQISGALRTFSKEREEYFGRVEEEVVRLSLSIARKILHRESQIDPLVLTGVVHVALQKLNSDTRVRLRTHPDEVRFWNDYYRQSGDIFPTVEVLGDPSLPPGHCMLETDFGSTQISLDTQLKEIEQGFFDLLEQRPKGVE